MKNLIKLGIFLAFTYLVAIFLMFAIWTIFFENIDEEHWQWRRGLFGEWPKGFRWQHGIDVLTQF